MEKQPFTPSGLEQLLIELYALPETELQQQADDLRNAPKVWIQDQFELDSNQQNFLDNLPQNVTQFLGDQGSFAIANQLPITLSKDGDGKDPDGKLFFPKSSLNISTTADGNTQAGGSLEIQVTYPSK